MLEYDNWQIDFCPEIGGSLTKCSYDGHDILRPAPLSAPTNARQTSAFPILPFIGRIENGRFSLAGQPIQLPANLPPEPHAIHGHGWQNPWQIRQQEADKIWLFNSHDGVHGWPWSYEAHQGFTIKGQHLSVELVLTNTANSPMPAGLGWHPYFPKRGATLQAPVSEIWQAPDGDIIGSRPANLSKADDLRYIRDVEDLVLDHCYSTERTGTRLSWPEKKLSIFMTASEPLGHLTVFTPRGETYFCVEPVSQIPNAVNSSLEPDLTGFRTLRPGEKLSAEIMLSVSIDGGK